MIDCNQHLIGRLVAIVYDIIITPCAFFGLIPFSSFFTQKELLGNLGRVGVELSHGVFMTFV